MKIIGTCVSCSHRYCAKKVSLFQSFSDEMLGKVTALIKRETYSKGEPIFCEGDAFNKLYIVNGGSMKIFRTNKEGKEQILYILSEGEFIGDINLLKSDLFKFSATALEDTHICTISKSDFDELIQIYPELVTSVLESAYDRIQSLEQMVQTLTMKDIDTRLAKLLIQLAQDFGIRSGPRVEVPLKLTREEMAALIGLTRETISRKLSAFQSMGYIDLKDKNKLIITDFDSLTELSEL